MAFHGIRGYLCAGQCLYFAELQLSRFYIPLYFSGISVLRRELLVRRNQNIFSDSSHLYIKPATSLDEMSLVTVAKWTCKKCAVRLNSRQALYRHCKKYCIYSKTNKVGWHARKDVTIIGHT